METYNILEFIYIYVSVSYVTSDDVGVRPMVIIQTFGRIIRFCDREALRRTVAGRRREGKYNEILLLWFKTSRVVFKSMIIMKIELLGISLVTMTEIGTPFAAKFSYRQTDEMRSSVTDICRSPVTS